MKRYRRAEYGETGDCMTCWICICGVIILVRLNSVSVYRHRAVFPRYLSSLDMYSDGVIDLHSDDMVSRPTLSLIERHFI